MQCEASNFDWLAGFAGMHSVALVRTGQEDQSRLKTGVSHESEQFSSTYYQWSLERLKLSWQAELVSSWDPLLVLAVRTWKWWTRRKRKSSSEGPFFINPTKHASAFITAVCSVSSSILNQNVKNGHRELFSFSTFHGLRSVWAYGRSSILNWRTVQ